MMDLTLPLSANGINCFYFVDFLQNFLVKKKSDPLFFVSRVELQQTITHVFQLFWFKENDRRLYPTPWLNFPVQVYKFLGYGLKLKEMFWYGLFKSPFDVENALPVKFLDKIWTTFLKILIFSLKLDLQMTQIVPNLMQFQQ